MVLYCIVRSARKELRDFSPPIALGLVAEEENPLFVICPRFLIDPRVEVVVPPFSTLLADSSWNMLCYESPLLGPILFYEVDHKLVFFLCPGHLLGLLSLRALNQLLGSSQYVVILSCIALIRGHHLQLLLLIVFLLLRFIIGVFGLAAVR